VTYIAPITTAHKWLSLTDERLTEYNSRDTVATARLAAVMRRELRGTHNWDFWQDRWWPLVPVVMGMQARGVGQLDRAARNQLRREVRAQVEDVEGGVWSHVHGADLYNRDTFFNSPKQLVRWLYGDLGLPRKPATLTQPAGGSSQESLVWTLSKLKPSDDRAPLLHELFHRSRLSTILERYLTVEGDPDGRLRPTIKLYGTETLRLAYAGGPGEAVHQWPPECRRLVRAAPGKIFIGRDYSQIEARLLAYFSRDTRSTQTLESGGDLHTANALDLFGFSPDRWLDVEPVLRMALRNFAKVFLYGLSYGADPHSLSTKLFCPCWRCAAKAPPQANLSRAEIVAAATRWESLHTPIFAYRDALLQSIKGRGSDSTWTSPWGFRRRWFEPGGKAKRSIYNFPMQHGASQIINTAMLELDKWDAPMTLQMHDELVLEVPVSEADHWDELLQSTMERPVPQVGNVSFPTTGHRGETWADLK
jgi:DNA polymerase-1